MFGGFLLGCFVGIIIGVFTMCIFYIKNDDDRGE